jgi:AraC family transcriptional regulator
MDAAAGSVPVTFGSPLARTTEVDGFLVGDVRFGAGLRLPTHTHDRATVAVLLAGSMEQFGGHGQRTDCRPASVLVEPAGEPHGNRFEAVGARVLTLQPAADTADLLGPCAALVGQPRHVHDQTVAAIATRVAHELRAPDDLTPLSVLGLVLELMARTARLATPPVRRAPAWLLAARDLLHERFAEPLRVADVAAAAGVHPVHLARMFRVVYGTSVAGYLRGLRVDWAAARLAGTDEPIAQVAAAAGFADQSHLTRAMRARLGVTPARLRQAARG